MLKTDVVIGHQVPLGMLEGQPVKDQAGYRCARLPITEHREQFIQNRNHHAFGFLSVPGPQPNFAL